VVLVFAPEILRVWLGPEYAAQSATALRWLAAGVFANSLAAPLLVMLYAKNRPDLPARFHLLELAIHIPLTIYLIRVFGIAGAAAAWAARATLDMCLLLWGARRVSGSPASVLLGGRFLQTATSTGLLVVGLSVCKILGTMSLVAGVVGVIAASAAFAAATWWWILGDAERAAIAGTIGSYVKFIPASRRDRLL
jgi:O-antigen/teichoic acid export membrane protein